MNKYMIAATLIAVMTSQAAAECVQPFSCQYRVFNRTAETLEVIVVFPDGKHRCDGVLQSKHNLWCTRQSTVPPGERHSIVYSPSRILAGRSTSTHGVVMSCQWNSRERYEHRDWTIVTPHPGKCEIVNAI